MNKNSKYLYKIATYEHELKQIHQLNYQTFVEEIPQHEENDQKELIDSFHDDNTYLICLDEDTLVGMIAIRDKRPFSLDKKIGKVEASLPIQVNKLCEIRLLSVRKEYRNGRVFLGLTQFLTRYCLEKGYNVTVISGTVRQLKLYRQMGFIPFAHLVGTKEAQYQPMYLTKESFEQSVAGRQMQRMIKFLPGPVHMNDDMYHALAQETISHRNDLYQLKWDMVKKRLCKMVNAKELQILLGSGTLANDCIAAQLSLLQEKGLILCNGEFGKRLIDHAKRWKLSFEIIEKNYGEPFTNEDFKRMIQPDTKWIWGVHCETSTGMVNDIELLKRICGDKQIKLCLDGISSIGAIPVNLEGVTFASGVSGKAIGGFTGLSFVFHHHPIIPSDQLPRYMDLGFYMKKGGIPFSQSSNLLEALIFALEEEDEHRYKRINEIHHYIRNFLENHDYSIVTSLANTAPTILTIAIKEHIHSSMIGEVVCLQGYQLHYSSEYLKKNNWIQVSCLGKHQLNDIQRMLHIFHQVHQYESKWSLLENKQ